MGNNTEYRWICERTAEPPVGYVPVGGLRVVNPVPAYERGWVFAGGRLWHATYGAGIPIVLAAASAASLESVRTGNSCIF
jgi:hypothetical protein